MDDSRTRRPSRQPRCTTQGPARVRRLLVPVVCALLCAVLAACAVTPAAKKAKPTSQPVAGAKELAALWPLTGERVTGGTPDRPVLVTKIDNTASSAPQVGLGKADLITEELVEGGATRLAVFFYQHLPRVAGPVRSMRASDIGIVQPAHAVLVSSGAAPPTVKRLRWAGITFFDDDIAPSSYYRDPARRIPYNLMVKPETIAARARSKAVVPASYLPWGSEKAWSGSAPARGMDVTFSPDHTTTWRWDGRGYENVNSFAAAGDRFRPDTVVVVRVHEGDAGYLDPAGHKVPETLWTGSGPAMVLHRGQVVRGTWTKSSVTAPVRFRTAAGALTIPAGHTWIELVPVDSAGGRVVVRR